MQKTTPETVDSKHSEWGALSALLGFSICWVYRETWAGNISWMITWLIAAAFTASLSKWAAGIFDKIKAYRMAILISFAVIVGCSAVLWLTTSTPLEAQKLALSLAASLFGGMIASWTKYGFMDETFIPTDGIITEIQRIYREQNAHTPRLPFLKRLFDVSLAAAGILISIPLWLVIGSLIWLQDPGPILFIKHCTGYQGKPFRLYKFRTMKTNAETTTGPVSAGEYDHRILYGCKFLRKTALDELPQLINILVGEMSFVGPRPLRSVVEVENIHQIPGYTSRFNTLPGLAGLAQICGDNRLPSRDKLRYERVYAENVSVLFDIKIMLIACRIVFYLRWKKDWDGRVPRAWIRFGS